MCKCKNIEIGSYDNQVMLKTPEFMRKQGKYGCITFREHTCVDKCLEKEIKYLWSLGITTIGCCCGHNKIDGDIGVILNDVEKMIDLGYKEQYFENSFAPKSV